MSVTGLIAQVITREVTMENEIVDLNVLFLNLNNTGCIKKKVIEL